MAALPSPQNVGGGPMASPDPVPGQEGSPIALGVEALSSKKENASGPEQDEKIKKYQALKPLN